MGEGSLVPLEGDPLLRLGACRSREQWEALVPLDGDPLLRLDACRPREL